VQHLPLPVSSGQYRMRKKQIVYSTAQGRMCPGCGQPVIACSCSRETSPAAGDGSVHLQRQTKGRNGKPVTWITGLALDPSALKQLCKSIKTRCGVGGTCVEGKILIQGDLRERLAEELKSRGFNVR
jgi:translation initiation factor 1